ncbi:branched-chain amino acid ABC transporter ATP-binding protein/permease [Actinomadura physcomitrii]|uniref:branched-chain amino acid ABC transporter ATP-binding protein/permease n=1 Tax=Actinomadura physcomitrii TaxID=2650748 RepID=UPI00136F9407|nr:ATP-binding cassette domain-containing protein [Actinomadura physcomitrii]
MLALLGAAVLAAGPWLGLGLDAQRQIILVAVLALAVGGLNLSFGYAGELALGQVLMYATGAYVVGYLSTIGVTNVLVTLPAAGLAGLLVGVVSGAAGLRLGGWVLALFSLLLLDLIPRIVNLLHGRLGGVAGLSGISRPTLGGLPFDNPTFYTTAIIVAALWFAAMRNLVHSRQGTAFLVLKESSVLAKALGISTYRTKLRAYALGAVPAGLGGALYAYLDGYIAPSVFTFELGLVILAAAILGGARSVYGAVIGAALLQLGPRQLSLFDQYAEVAYGIVLVLGGVFLSTGAAGLGHRVFDRLLGRARGEEGIAPSRQESVDVPPLPGEPLVVDSVTVRFGGFTALEDVSLRAEPGTVTAIIGPNGSGKTTLLNVVSGLLKPRAGEVRVGGSPVSGSTGRAVRHGVARTFQTPLVPASLNVREVVASGRLGSGNVTLVETVLRLPRYRRVRRADLAAARRALAAVGLSRAAGLRADALPLGTRRLMEFARALAADPAVLLLDEVASGLDDTELAELTVLIRAVREAGATVVLVEHNFELVREIADHVIVLAEGHVISTGVPERVARDEDVVRRYLGRRSAEGGDALTGKGTP